MKHGGKRGWGNSVYFFQKMWWCNPLTTHTHTHTHTHTNKHTHRRIHTYTHTLSHTHTSLMEPISSAGPPSQSHSILFFYSRCTLPSPLHTKKSKRITNHEEESALSEWESPVVFKERVSSDRGGTAEAPHTKAF